MDPPSSVSPTEVTALQAAAAPSAGADMLEAGARFGPYVVIRLLGEGGMGRVYLAEQLQPVHREVALKLIRDQVANPISRAYFEVERQALAQMQHPAIAQVFDAGTTEDGHPYLAMEVVEGRRITRFCSEDELPLEERLVLFARVCRGVQHAHQKGIIHRDLKPANVLVRRIDGEPMPKIIDFGIAIGQGELVGADAAGTAVYMSPEQSGRMPHSLDTRSDVYSLGVMLYEVLTDQDASALTTGAHRSQRAPHETLLAAIDEPARSGTGTNALLQASGHLPAELRAVLRKALAIDREGRYESAAALADDLDRYRSRRPLTAMRGGRLYPLRLFAARHRLGIVAGVIAAIALMTGMALALAGLSQARRSAEAARVEARKAEQIADFVQNMLAGIDPDRARSMDRQLMRTILDSAAERASRELADQPAVRASIEHTIANSYASLGELELAGSHYEAALAALDAAHAPSGQRSRLAIRIAENIDNRGDAKKALVAGYQALDIVASEPADDRDRLFVESHLAGLEGDAGKLEESRKRYQRVFGLQRSRFGENDDDTMDSMRGLAFADSALTRFDEARPLFDHLIERYTRRYGSEHSKTLNAINELAVLELDQRHYATAERLLAPVLKVEERVFGPEHPTTITVVANLGGAIRQQGRNEEARPYYERAYASALKVYGPTNPRTIFAESNLSLLLRDAGELADAERHARTAAANGDKTFSDNAYRGVMHKELATILTREGHYADAEHELDLAWNVLTHLKEYGESHPRSQDVVDAYVELYAAWHKPQLEAEWRARRNRQAGTD